MFSLAAWEDVSTEVEECYILGGWFAYLMQALLGALCMGSLLIKWWCEVPRRLFVVFMLDTSKQVVGALWYHVLNMAFAILLESMASGLAADECAWYFAFFVVDNTIGLFLNIVLIRISEKCISYDSGCYWKEAAPPDPADAAGGSAPQLDVQEWLKQISIYCLIVTVSKLIIMGAFCLTPQIWSWVGVAGTTWIKNKDMRLFFVMVLVPVIMDTTFFWITDEFIKFDEKKEDVPAEVKGALPAEKQLKTPAEQ